MAFSGGVFSRLYSWVAEAQAGNPIDPAKFDKDLNDMAGGLSLAILRDGTGKPTAPISWNGQRITNLAAPSIPGDAIGLGALPNSEVLRALGFTPVHQGGGVGQGTNGVFIGFDGTGLKATVDVTDQGYFWLGPSKGKGVFSAGGGYRLFPDGSLDQCGIVGVSGDVQISFPVAFPNACLGVQVGVNAGGTPGVLWSCLVDSISQFSFAARARVVNSGSSTVGGATSSATPTLYWRATGY